MNNTVVEVIRGFRIGNASDDDSPAWRREAQPSRDLELKLTQCYIVLGRRRKVTYKDS